jgi:excisionase family DNA binding protein
MKQTTGTKAPDASAEMATKVLEPQPIRLTYTIEEAAQLLGIGRSLAYEEAKARTLPGVRSIGCRYVVSKVELHRFLDDAA